MIRVGKRFYRQLNTPHQWDKLPRHSSKHRKKTTMSKTTVNKSAKVGKSSQLSWKKRKTPLKKPFFGKKVIKLPGKHYSLDNDSKPIFDKIILEILDMIIRLGTDIARNEKHKTLKPDDITRALLVLIQPGLSNKIVQAVRDSVSQYETSYNDGSREESHDDEEDT